jgi:hypothetical protein
MGRQREKRIERLLSEPSDYTDHELIAYLRGIGHSENTKGKTSGSRTEFTNSEGGQPIRFHRPHPGHVFKKVVVKDIINQLKGYELI